MKTKIVTILLITMIVTEIIILHNQNTEVKDKNNKLLEELEENNLIINNQVNLNEVLYEKQKLEDETMLVFKEEKPEELFEKEKEVGNKLLEEINLLEDKIIGLESNLSELEKKYSRLLKEYETKNTFYITGVPFINQYPNYPTGCESVALTILLKYYGVSVTPDDVIEALQKGPVPYTKNGVTYGGNPEGEFIGNPYSLNSYGVYERPLAEVANKFKPGITIATGTSFDEILRIVKKENQLLFGLQCI